MRKPLSELTDDEFTELIESGQTLKLGEVNELLTDVHVNAASLEAFGIDLRRARGAVHIRTSDFVTVCAAIAVHSASLARECCHRPPRAGS
jgi:hypothetical protein